MRVKISQLRLLIQEMLLNENKEKELAAVEAKLKNLEIEIEALSTKLDDERSGLDDAERLDLLQKAKDEKAQLLNKKGSLDFELGTMGLGMEDAEGFEPVD